MKKRTPERVLREISRLGNELILLLSYESKGNDHKLNGNRINRVNEKNEPGGGSDKGSGSGEEAESDDSEGGMGKKRQTILYRPARARA